MDNSDKRAIRPHRWKPRDETAEVEQTIETPIAEVILDDASKTRSLLAKLLGTAELDRLNEFSAIDVVTRSEAKQDKSSIVSQTVRETARENPGRALRTDTVPICDTTDPDEGVPIKEDIVFDTSRACLHCRNETC